jgi:GT2 family glycosyltransferase
LISASIVLYNTSTIFLNKLFNSFETFRPDVYIIIVDNSPTNILQSKIPPKYKYIHSPENYGYGHSHNLAITIANELNYEYHFIVNPDVYFNEDVITKLIDVITFDNNIGMIMPNIKNEDGTLQNLPKLLPTPLSIILRKLKFLHSLFPNYINNYEFRNFNKEKVYEVPIISGCFTIVRIEAFIKSGSFDPKYFLYFEDWDLSRRMSLNYKTIFYPKVSIIHNYASEANFKFNFFLIYCKSAYIYFNKWGWIFDNYRIHCNKKTLNQLNEN